MLILVDSREQKPYWVGSQCAKTALNVGDYTTANLLGLFHIERKSATDFYGSIMGQHNRFRKELLRAAEQHITLVVCVETTKEKFINKEFPGGSERLAKPDQLRKMIGTYETKYGIEFIWSVTRIKGKQLVFKRLQHEEKKKTKKVR